MIHKSTGLSFLVWCILALSAEASYEWQCAEELADNTVAQLWANTIYFDWLCPWKIKGQGQSCGTGFFFKIPGQIDDDGYILTNYHVIEEACSVSLYIPSLGKQSLSVTLIGTCPERDVALLKLTDESLQEVKKTLGSFPHLRLGNSDELQRAMPVMALGYPLGQRYIKSTVGVIAGREYIDGESFIHITAPINPGNSGGPLLNQKGEVIGINTAGIQEASNVGYIVPINDIKILIEGMLRKGLVRKPSLGITVQPTTNEHASLLNNPVPSGMLLRSVAKESFAEKIGLQKGDCIYAMNGYRIDKYCDVIVNWKAATKISFGEFLTRLPLDTPIEFTLYRNGQEKKICGILEDPFLYPIRTIYPELEPNETDYSMIGGMVVMQLRKNHFELLQSTPTLIQHTKPGHATKGTLVVTCLLPGSPLEMTECLFPGAIITSVNGVQVNTHEEFYSALQASKQTGYLSIATDDDSETAVSLSDLKEAEPILAHNFMYAIKPAIENLLEL